MKYTLLSATPRSTLRSSCSTRRRCSSIEEQSIEELNSFFFFFSHALIMLDCYSWPVSRRIGSVSQSVSRSSFLFKHFFFFLSSLSPSFFSCLSSCTNILVTLNYTCCCCCCCCCFCFCFCFCMQ